MSEYIHVYLYYSTKIIFSRVSSNNFIVHHKQVKSFIRLDSCSLVSASLLYSTQKATSKSYFLF